MANITINEISQNYTYNIGTNSFCTVALPITASWGPAYMDPETAFDDSVLIENGGIYKDKNEAMLESIAWTQFPATQAGLESFVATYRGPASNYKLAQDMSYQMAMTLLVSGYDVLVCRVSPGSMSQGIFAKGKWTQDSETNEWTFEPKGKEVDGTMVYDGLYIKAKYPGTFGNNLRIRLTKITRNKQSYWNIVTYIVDASGIQTAVENLVFVFDIENSTDTILHIDELVSNFLTFEVKGILDESAEFGYSSRVWNSATEEWDNVWVKESGMLFDGTDKPDNTTSEEMLEEAVKLASARYTAAGYDTINAASLPEYIRAIAAKDPEETDINAASKIKYNEWLYNSAYQVYSLLTDKLAYNPNRIISPGWDDQDINAIDGLGVRKIDIISPLHLKLMDTAYFSRCATGLIDIPKSSARSTVYDDSAENPGYAQKLSRYERPNAAMDVNAVLYHSHSALCAPWGQYTYVGTGKQNVASPAFLTLLIQRAMILNQTLQYEWALPTNRKHNLNVGKLDYKVPKKLLDIWQTLEGVGVNVITHIPDIGIGLWGNSTLFEVPPATYQALANLSTRYLVNAVEDIAYKCGLSITFQYNNEQAYNKFYAGVTPTLDTMKNVGAITDFYVKMAADINGLDQVNANTVIGKIYLIVEGVINDIIVDLIALPPNADLNQYKS